MIAHLQRRTNAGGKIGIGGQFILVAENRIKRIADRFLPQVRRADEIRRHHITFQPPVQPLRPAPPFLRIVRMTVADKGAVAAGGHV